MPPSLVIGSPAHTGNIHINAEYSGGLANKLMFNSSGEMWISKPITMPSGTGSSLDLLLSGANSLASITTAPDIVSTGVIPGGRLAADNIVLRANNMTLGASITGTGTNGGNVALMPHTPTAAIQLGGAAADGFDLLGLQDSELALISTRALQIGGNPGQSGGLVVDSKGADFRPSWARPASCS